MVGETPSSSSVVSSLAVTTAADAAGTGSGGEGRDRTGCEVLLLLLTFVVVPAIGKCSKKLRLVNLH